MRDGGAGHNGLDGGRRRNGETSGWTSGVSARNLDSGSNTNDGDWDRCNRRGSRATWALVGNTPLENEGRVLLDVRSADTSEELVGRAKNFVRSPGINTVKDVLGEVGVLAVAVGRSVALTASLEHPGVEALGENRRAVLARGDDD